MKYNALYGRGKRENAYDIHSRTRLPHLACVTNIWPSYAVKYKSNSSALFIEHGFRTLFTSQK